MYQRLSVARKGTSVCASVLSTVRTVTARSEPGRFLKVLFEFLDASPPAAYRMGEWRDLLRLGQPYATNSPRTARASMMPIGRAVTRD